MRSIGLVGEFVKEVLNGLILSIVLIDWIVFLLYVYVLEEDVSQLQMVSLNNNSIEKGQQL
jgi:hypothetical protein